MGPSHQHLALKMCSKNWSADYHSLLSTFNIPCLSSRRTIAKLILLHKFIYKQMYIPENFFSFHHQHSHNLRSCHPHNSDCQLSQTSASQYSFFPTPLHFGTPFLLLQSPSTPQMNSNPTNLPCSLQGR